MSNNELMLHTKVDLNQNLSDINFLVDSLLELAIKDLKPNQTFSQEIFFKKYSLNNLILNKFPNYHLSKIDGLLLHNTDSSSFFLYDSKDKNLITEILKHKINSIFINLNLKSLANFNFTDYSHYSNPRCILYFDKISFDIAKDDIVFEIQKYILVKQKEQSINNSLTIFKPEKDFCQKSIEKQYQLNETIVKDIFMSSRFFGDIPFYSFGISIDSFKEYVSKEFFLKFAIYVQEKIELNMKKQTEKDLLIQKHKEEKIKEYNESKKIELEKNKKIEKFYLTLFLIFLFLIFIIFIFK